MEGKKRSALKGARKNSHGHSTAELFAALRWRQHSPADALILARRRVNRELRLLHLAAAVYLYPHAGCQWHCERVTALKEMAP